MVHAHAGVVSRPQVLVWLANPKGLVLINRVLTSAGFAVTSVTVKDELEDAMRSGGFSAIVTATEGVELIQQLSQLPLIDIQAFIPEWKADQAEIRTWFFNRTAFLGHIRAAITENSQRISCIT